MKITTKQNKGGHIVFNEAAMDGRYVGHLAIGYPLNSLPQLDREQLAQDAARLLEFYFHKAQPERYIQTKYTLLHILSWEGTEIKYEHYHSNGCLHTGKLREADVAANFFNGNYTWATRRDWYVLAPIGGDDTLMAISLALGVRVHKGNTDPDTSGYLPVQQYKVVKNEPSPKAQELTDTPRLEMELLYKVMQTPEYLQAVMKDLFRPESPNVTAFLRQTFGDGLAATYQRLSANTTPRHLKTTAQLKFDGLDSPQPAPAGYGPPYNQPLPDSRLFNEEDLIAAMGIPADRIAPDQIKVEDAIKHIEAALAPPKPQVRLKFFGNLGGEWELDDNPHVLKRVNALLRQLEHEGVAKRTDTKYQVAAWRELLDNRNMIFGVDPAVEGGDITVTQTTGPSGAIYTESRGAGHISTIQTVGHPGNLYNQLYPSQGDFAILPPTDS